MPFIETDIDGVVIFEPKVFEDERGYFFESYNESMFKEFGIENRFVQDNQSYSQYGTIRGLHFQTGDSAQAKLVRVLKGTVVDVAVDLRPNSDTRGEHVAVELSAENQRQLFVPRGFAHGFSVVSPEAIFVYKCDNFYDRDAEGGIRYDDPALGIDWRVPTGEALVNEKDLMNPSYAEHIEGSHHLS